MRKLIINLFLFFAFSEGLRASPLNDNPNFDDGHSNWFRDAKNGCFYPLCYKEYYDEFKKSNNFHIVDSKFFAISHIPGEWGGLVTSSSREILPGRPIWAAVVFKFSYNRPLQVRMRIVEKGVKIRQVLKKRDKPKISERKGSTVHNWRSIVEYVRDPYQRVIYEKHVTLANAGEKWIELFSDYPVHVLEGEDIRDIKVNLEIHHLATEEGGDFCVFSGQLVHRPEDFFHIIPND